MAPGSFQAVHRRMRILGRGAAQQLLARSRTAEVVMPPLPYCLRKRRLPANPQDGGFYLVCRMPSDGIKKTLTSSLKQVDQQWRTECAADASGGYRGVNYIVAIGRGVAGVAVPLLSFSSWLVASSDGPDHFDSASSYTPAVCWTGRIVFPGSSPYSAELRCWVRCTVLAGMDDTT